MAAAGRVEVERITMRLRRPLMAVVTQVAADIGRAQARLRPGDVTRKSIGDFVTRIDLRSERRLARELPTLLPDAGFLGEESDPRQLDRDWLWVVDPIDGTSNYSRGLPQFAVSVALLHCGQPVLGVVHCAPEQRTYAAVHGLGAWRDRRRIEAPAGRFDDGAIIGCQWFRGQADMTFLAQLQSRGARIRTLGSTVVQLADVVSGRLDGNVQQQGRLWDFAAAGLIATEAGLRFSDWRGKDVFPLRDVRIGHVATVCAGRAVHRELLRLLAPFA